MPLISFYTPWKHQKTGAFLRFSGGIERQPVASNRLTSFLNPLKILENQRLYSASRGNRKSSVAWNWLKADDVWDRDTEQSNDSLNIPSFA